MPGGALVDLLRGRVRGVTVWRRIQHLAGRAGTGHVGRVGFCVIEGHVMNVTYGIDMRAWPGVGVSWTVAFTAFSGPDGRSPCDKRLSSPAFSSLFR